MKFRLIPNYLVFICLYVVLIYRYLLMFDRNAVLLALLMTARRRSASNEGLIGTGQGTRDSPDRGNMISGHGR